MSDATSYGLSAAAAVVGVVARRCMAGRRGSTVGTWDSRGRVSRGSTNGVPRTVIVGDAVVTLPRVRDLARGARVPTRPPSAAAVPPRPAGAAGPGALRTVPVRGRRHRAALPNPAAGPPLWPPLPTVLAQPGLSVVAATDEHLRLLAGAESYVRAVTRGGFEVFACGERRARPVVVHVVPRPSRCGTLPGCRRSASPRIPPPTNCSAATR